MEQSLLLVDDEENVIRSLRRLFRQEPYKIYFAFSAQEGLDVLSKNSIAVILSDQRMPGMIGSDFLKLVKESYPDTIRLVMSGYTELESITSAINDGAVFRFLLKPWDDQKLLGHVSEAFSYYNLKASNKKLTDDLKRSNEKLESILKEERFKNGINASSVAFSKELIDKIPFAILGISSDGMIVLANQQAHKLLARENIVGLFAEDIFNPSILIDVQKIISGSFIGEKIEFYWPGGSSKKAYLTPLCFGEEWCACMSVN